MEIARTVRQARLDQLDALTAADALLEAPKLVLLTGTIPPGETPAVGDLTIATFHGYADASPTPGDAYIDVASGLLIKPFADHTFTATSGGTIDDVITGWALLNTGKTLVGAIYAYETPIPITEAGDGITVEPALTFGR